MSLPPLLKSKFFWSFSFVTGGLSSAVAYDRYEAHRLKEVFMKQAMEYGKQPLLLSEKPRCLSFLLLSPSSTEHRATLQVIRAHALDILTAAGVDYRWIVEVDGEEAKMKWDDLARERNEPELMREQQCIPLEELNSNILSHILKRKLEFKPENTIANEAEDKSEQLWSSLRSIYTQDPSTWPPTSDGLVTFDSFTSESLKSALIELKSELSAAIAGTAVKPVKSWWSRSKKDHPITVTPSPSSSAELYLVPCAFSQSPLSRLQRFLFGQRHVTRSVGDAVMQCIREQSHQTIHK